MSLNEVFSHLIEDYAIKMAKRQIYFNPFLTIRQKQPFCYALDLYSDMRKVHFCLKLMQSTIY